MLRFLRADMRRLLRSRLLALFALGMLLLAAAMMTMQATAMDYTVLLSRVVFLPLSLYGMVMAAFVGAFVGGDFSGGFIRNKLLAAKRRAPVVLSQIAACCAAAAAVYGAATALTWGAGRYFFENNLDGGTFLRYALVGLGMSLATGSLFCALSMLCASRMRALVVCMSLAFGMLLLALHTNGLLVQTPYRDGAINPHYVGGARRAIYMVLHDFNPCGQAAQLSAWQVMRPGRCALLDLMWVLLSALAGCGGFERKNID